MKVTNTQTTLFFLLFYFAFNLNISHAEVCVKPTAPVCYTNQTTDSENYIGKDKQGSQWIEKTTTTKQVETSCYGSQKQINYELEMTQYNVCLQVAEIKAATLLNSNTQKQNLNQDTKVYKRVCPLPVQPEKQLSQNVIATNEFGNGTVIKQYGDGSYAIFNKMGEYEGIANSVMFDNAKNYQYALKELAKSNNTPSRIAELNDYAYLMNKNGESVQLSIDKRLSDINNCPKTKLSCPENSTLSTEDGMCDCNYGYANDNNGGCETMDKWCIDIFGPLYYFDGSGNHIGACKIKDNVPTTSKTATSKNIATKATTKKLNHTPASSTSVQPSLINVQAIPASTTKDKTDTNNRISWTGKIKSYIMSLLKY